MRYINPLYLLQLSGIKIPTEKSEVRTARKRLLQEFDLSDGQSLSLNGQIFFKNDAVVFLDELDNPAKFLHHMIIFEHRPLCDFLMGFEFRGNLPIKEELTRGRDTDVINYISPFFALEFGKLLLGVVKGGCEAEVRRVTSIPFLAQEKDIDTCYSPTQAYLNSVTLAELESIDTWLGKTNCGKAEIDSLVSRLCNLAQPNTLNLLPDYYREQRNQIAKRLRSIAISINNKNEMKWGPMLRYNAMSGVSVADPSVKETLPYVKVALRILILADSVVADALVRNQIQEDLRIVRSNVVIGRKNSFQQVRERAKELAPISVFVVIGLIIILAQFFPSGEKNEPPKSKEANRVKVPETPSPQNQLDERITAGKARITQMESDLDKLSKELELSEARIKRLKRSIKLYEDRSGDLTQIDIDDLNAKVEEHNRIVASHNGENERYQTLYKTYSALIESVNAMVEQYNRSGR